MWAMSASHGVVRYGVAARQGRITAQSEGSKADHTLRLVITLGARSSRGLRGRRAVTMRQIAPGARCVSVGDEALQGYDRLLGPANGGFRDMRMSRDGVETVLRVRSSCGIPSKSLSGPDAILTKLASCTP
jgi:hypothetical protein